MRNVIIIDTNIYRQLGALFYNHIDYISLEGYCYSSASEILLSQTVVTEFIDFYKREIIDKNILEIEKSYDRLGKLEYFKKIRKPDLNKRAKQQLDFVKIKLTRNKRKPKLDLLLNENDLLEFLISNKQENKKDNTRDYLIWLNGLAAAKKYPGWRVILISEDKIFVENLHFNKIKEKLSVKHFEVYKSIPSFLSIYGFKSPLLTKDLILQKIPVSTIRKELLRDKDSIPSYISDFYYDARRKFPLEKFEIQEILVDEFYSHKSSPNKVEVIAHVLVKVNMIFAPETKILALKKYLEKIEATIDRKTNSFDGEGRPIYNEYILFTFRLNFSEVDGVITNVKFIDFFLDDYIRKNIQNHIGLPHIVKLPYDDEWF